MAPDSIVGDNYSFDGNTIAFFGRMGVRMTPTVWLANLRSEDGGEVNEDWTFDEPIHLANRVRALVSETIDAGYKDLLTQILADPRHGVLLFLGEVFNVNHLGNACEGIGFVDIPNVEVDKHLLTVRVARDAEYPLATADREGNLLIISRT